MTLIDAGVLVAVIDHGQSKSQACRKALQDAALPLVTTWPALAEAMHLLGRIGGWPLQRALWAHMEAEALDLYVPEADGRRRMCVLMERYRDTPMDLADASLVVAGEQLGISRILTLDRDFRVYRIHGKGTFEVVP